MRGAENSLSRIRKKGISWLMLLFLILKYRKWFLLSVAVCMVASQVYLELATPVYEVSCKMLFKRPDKHYRSNRMMVNITTPGSVSSTTGAEEEVEKIWTCRLMSDVVRNLKLYTEYRVEDWPKDRMVYARQPVSVDLDPMHLDSLDQIVYDAFCTIMLQMSVPASGDSGVSVRGVLLRNDEAVWGFRRRLKQLPASIDTPFGTLTFIRNLQDELAENNRKWTVQIVPVTYAALSYLSELNVTPVDEHSSDRLWFSRFYKRSFMAKLTVADTDIRRATDIIRQIAASYNYISTLDTREVALRTENFINERINRISQELDIGDSRLAGIAQHSGLTALSDAGQALSSQNQMSESLAEVAAEKEILSELSAYVSAPQNRYAIIPSNITASDAASEKLIKQYNQTVMERSRLLRSTSPDAPQVKLLTTTADELSAAIADALQHARQAIEISQDGIKAEYNKFRGVVTNAPSVEHAMKVVGRDQTIRAKLYSLLLQKREENSILQASVADNGRLTDEPLCEGQVRPRVWLVYGIGLASGILIPYGLFVVWGLLRYKIEGREDVAELTELPIIGEIPQAAVLKGRKAGIVVQADRNEPMDETFRQLRTNIFFLLKESQHVILLTSSISGEGKTFVAANLAASYAALGKRVLLCGLDIRKPALGRQFGLPDCGRGITNLLKMDSLTQQDVTREILPSGIAEGLDLMLAGPIPPNPPELLARGSFVEILSILKSVYDYVILDTAPVGLVTDTLQISRHADVTIYVCRVHHTPKRAFCMVNDLSKQDKITNPCIVINSVKWGEI